MRTLVRHVNNLTTNLLDFFYVAFFNYFSNFKFSPSQSPFYKPKLYDKNILLKSKSQMQCDIIPNNCRLQRERAEKEKLVRQRRAEYLQNLSHHGQPGPQFRDPR